MLITPEYQKQQESMHASQKINYGTTAAKYGQMVGEIIDSLGINRLLDYGCGHNLSLQENLKPQKTFQYQGYDPGVPDYAEPPEPAELVVCIDVLEHIEPDCLNDVLDHLESLTEQILFATVHTGPAGKILPDGRNAHLIQKPAEWWLPRFTERWTMQSFQARSTTGFEVICLANDYDSRLRPVNGSGRSC